MAIARTSHNKNIDQLNSFLRGEIAAVETYQMALDKISGDSPVRAQLQSCKQSHARRVTQLQQKIQALGGSPSQKSGAWGAFAKVFEGGAKLLGDKAAIAALEEGEDHGLKDYRIDLDKLDPEARELVTSELLPQQEETHRALSTLKHEQSRHA